jgi:hypothetical protein
MRFNRPVDFDSQSAPRFDEEILMIGPFRFAVALLIAFSAPWLSACQSPTKPDSLEVDDFLEVSATPNPTTATASTDGLTYRVVRGNNQPDDILAFDWKTSFSVTATLNSKADDKDVLEFPVDLTAVTLAVKQASGGIVTPPTGGEVEHFTYVTQASGNRYETASSSLTISFEVWYDLPSLRKEALVTVTLAFQDKDGQTFTKSVDVRVAP